MYLRRLSIIEGDSLSQQVEPKFKFDYEKCVNILCSTILAIE